MALYLTNYWLVILREVRGGEDADGPPHAFYPWRVDRFAPNLHWTEGHFALCVETLDPYPPMYVSRVFLMVDAATRTNKRDAVTQGRPFFPPSPRELDANAGTQWALARVETRDASNNDLGPRELSTSPRLGRVAEGLYEYNRRDQFRRNRRRNVVN